MKKICFSILILFCYQLFGQTNNTDSIEVLLDVEIIGKKAKTLTGSGEYIPSATLSKLNQNDINKVLRLIPGVNIRDEEGFGLRPNIGLRGTSVNRSAKITLMEDGILVAPAPYSDPSAYYFPSFTRMQALEVLKGSSQIKYGPNTIGGAVNLISTTIPNSFNAFAKVSYGSFETNQERVWVGDSKKNFDYLFEVNRYASNGFKEVLNLKNTGFERTDWLVKLRWHSAATAKFYQAATLKYLNTTEEGNETYLGLTYSDFLANPYQRYAITQKDRLDLKHQELTLNYVISILKNVIFSTSAYYMQTGRNWGRANSVMGVGLSNIINNPIANATAYEVINGTTNGNGVFQAGDRTYSVKGIQSFLKYKFNKGLFEHNFELGWRWHEDAANRYATNSNISMIDGRVSFTSYGLRGNNENQIRSAKSVAAFLKYDLVYKGLTISPGIRYENIDLTLKNYGILDNNRLGTNVQTASNSISIVLPGIGFSYDFSKGMNVFGGVHKGFSPPGVPVITATPSTQAQTEIAVNYEIGYRYNIGFFRLQATGFFSDYENILGSDNLSGGGDGTGNMFNAGKAKIYGLEFFSEFDFFYFLRSNPYHLKLPLSVSYTFTDARFAQTFINGGGDWGTGQINKGDVIPFITPQLLTLRLSIENSIFNLSLVTRYVGSTRTKPGQNEEVFPTATIAYSEINSIAAYWVSDLSANYRFSKVFMAFGEINNLFDLKYTVSNLPQGFLAGIPLAVNLGIKMEL